MTNILFLHQSADLYGSDKTLLLLLKHLDKSKFYPIVIIPLNGSLKEELEKENINVIIAPVLKLYRKMFTPRNILKFFREINSGIELIDEINKKWKIDLIYTNTLAALLGFFYARKRNIKHIWHVHEIIKSPKIFKHFFLKLLESNANNTIVHNSLSTQSFWAVNTKIAEKSTVIWNGLELPKGETSLYEIATIRKSFFKIKQDEIVIALVGRISRWKGQQLLLKTFNSLLLKHQNIKLVFIGSPPPNQDNFLEDLNNEINKYKLADKVLIIPFQQEIFKFWQSVDIVVVPSTEPEPFGLVAVEAMLAKKPVIAANHGGITEIVVHNETGLLFEPNNKIALYEAIHQLIENPQMRDVMGVKGFQRATVKFSIETYVHNFENLFLNLK